MGQSGPFVSSCTRRQMARRRGWPRRSWTVMVPPALALTLIVVLAGATAFLAGHGTL